MKKSPVTKKRVAPKAKAVTKSVRKAAAPRRKAVARSQKPLGMIVRSNKNSFSDVKVMVAVIALLVATGLSIYVLPVWAQ